MRTSGVQTRVIEDIFDEVSRQHAKYGVQSLPYGTGSQEDIELAKIAKARCKANTPAEDNWRDILNEEITEAFAESDLVRLREELIQSIAVQFNIVAQIDRARSANDHS
jgi:hypothetical protein